ncbi:MAG: TIGR03016 family PEP-CTERM system-associated outer membrane protein, partial [Motiliproteus sp.]|nr:TIGR03016 family PEP-CTERM system-associated outer membrane protein [Motiliproteus sp.]
MRTVNRWSFAPIISFSLLISSAVTYGADWKFTPSLQVNEDYTNNLELTKENKEDSFITQVRPGFSLSKQGGRVQADIKYGLQHVEYSSDQGSDSNNHQLTGTLKAELVEQHLFVDVDASISQELSSNLAASNGNNLNNASSRTDTTTFSISPYWQQRIGDDTTAGVRLTYSEVNFDDSSTTDTDGIDISFFTDTQSNSGKIHWGVNVDASQSERTASVDDESENISLSVGYRSSAQLDTTLTYGFVDNHVDNPTDSSADSGDFWGLSVNWSPNPRTNINASYNSRLQSVNDYGLSVNYRRKQSTWTVNYTESISSVRQQLLNRLYLVCDSDGSNCDFISDNNPIVSPDQIVIDLNTPIPSIINDRFIQKGLSGNVVISGKKSTYSIGLFAQEREYQTGTSPKETNIG